MVTEDSDLVTEDSDLITEDRDLVTAVLFDVFDEKGLLPRNTVQVQ